MGNRKKFNLQKLKTFVNIVIIAIILIQIKANSVIIELRQNLKVSICYFSWKQL